MLIHYIKITLRVLYKDKAFSIINILGLSIAIACCFLLIFWIKFETSFEDIYPNKDRIYKLIVEEKRKDGLYYKIWTSDIATELRNNFPQIEAATCRYVENTSMNTIDTEGDGVMVDVASANHDYLKIFGFEYLKGSPKTGTQKRYCIITKEAARKFFGSESPLNKVIHRGQFYTVKVGAVVDLPSNTQLKFDVLDLNPSFSQSGEHYIMLKAGEKMTPQLKEQLSAFLSTKTDTKDRLVVQALSDVHLHSPMDIMKAERHGLQDRYGNYTQLIYFSVAVLLILLMAIINYVNTSIARAMTRMKEVGVRKVTGAKKRQLMERFLFESFIITIISLLISFVFTRHIFPIFSEMMGNKEELVFDWLTIAIAMTVCIVIAALSGGYAAFYLSSFKPAFILQGGAKSGSKDRLRSGLLGVQFFLSVGVLICTVFIYKQINAIFNESSGMDRNNIIILDTNLWYDAENFIKIIKQENPNIIDASMANCPPYNAPWSYTGVTWEGMKTEPEDLSFTQIFCDHNYASTFGLEILQGEFIPPGLPWWQWSEAKSFNIVVNESFAKLMGTDNPLGVSVKYAYATGKIIGVVKDFNFKPLKEKSVPLFMTFNPESQTYLYIKTSGKDKQATLDYILKKYKEMKPEWMKRPVVYHTVEDEFNKMYDDEIRSANMLSVFSVISLFLSLMGVVSMVSFMIEKRTKEIAIRKINGAKTPDIILLFWKDIVRIATVASILAIPLTYIIIHSWLEGYIYRTTLSWWIFLAIPILLIALICLIIAIQVIYTAGQKPVESLRSE